MNIKNGMYNMFELYNDTIAIPGECLYKELQILTKYNYLYMKSEGAFEVLREATASRSELLNYNRLPAAIKKLLHKKMGSPNDWFSYQKALSEIVLDPEAKHFFDVYRLPNGQALPEKKKCEYLSNAMVLNWIEKQLFDKDIDRNLWDELMRKVHNLPLFLHPHKLPKNRRSFIRKYIRYIGSGANHRNYQSLIHKGFCNDNSEKLPAEAKDWLLSRWADRVHKCPSLNALLQEYNALAEKQAWKPVKEAQTLSNFLYRKGVKHLWYGHRYGDAKAKEKFVYQHSTSLPSMRDSLWYSDGTKLNYYYRYQNEKGQERVGTCLVYEVMDAYSELLLGYHICDTENYKAQFNAYKMAVQYAGHRPYQIGFDGQGGHQKLQASRFFEKLAQLAIRTAPYNGKSKTIESAFGRFQSQHLKKDWFFTGQNIDAKKGESKANQEFIQANKKLLPVLEEVKKQYAKRREEWNHALHPQTGIPRIQMYQESVNPKSAPIAMWDMVDLFWMLREKPVKCTAYGISFKEQRRQHQYMVYREDDIPDIQWLREHIDQKFYIKYDPEDLSSIYLYQQEANGLRFVAEARPKITIHRAIQEQEDWEAAFIQQVKSANEKARVKADQKMDELLEKEGRLPEQYGLHSPGLIGMKSKKKTNAIASVQKETSMKVNHIPERSQGSQNIYELIAKTNAISHVSKQSNTK